MKIRKKKNPSAKGAKVEPGDVSGTVKIWHSQSIKQSRNFGNAADCAYGIQITVPDNDDAIEIGVARCEEFVEKQLTSKYREQKTLMDKISPE
jgi:hypothetical protein